MPARSRRERGNQTVSDEGAESKYQSLERYSRDLTKLAAEGKLDPVIGREPEIKILLGCSEEEIQAILDLHNSGPMRSLLLRSEKSTEKPSGRYCFFQFEGD
jgi:hypothetical protein